VLGGETYEQIESSIAEHDATVKRRVAKHDAVQAQVLSNARLIGMRSRIEDFDRVVEDGKKVRAEVDAVDGPALHKAYGLARDRLNDAGQRHRMAKAQVEEKRALAQGRFDGRCPVAGIECPAKAQINKDRARGESLYEEAREAMATALHEYDEASRAEALIRADVQAHDRIMSKLEAMRAQASRMQREIDDMSDEDKSEPEDPNALRLRLEDAARRRHDAEHAAQTARARVDQLVTIEKTRAALLASLKDVQAKLSTRRAAAVIFGKQGAQRKVAEGALSEIEDASNDMLRETGIGLSVAVRWSREGQGLARACEACGAPFPASAKVKVCTRCKAGRGPNLINRLEVELSDRSGAAEDLGGAAIQLAASAWLRAERGSAWEVAMLDEPFGALDSTHRRAFGRHVAAMLSGRYGFRQGFVVAHSPDVLASLPGRIEIVGGKDGSSVRVVA
jgi:hypothetical protein